MPPSDIQQRLEQLEQQNKAQSEMLASMRASLDEILAIVDAGKEFFRIAEILARWANRLARFFAPILAVATASAGLYHYLKGLK